MKNLTSDCMIKFVIHLVFSCQFPWELKVFPRELTVFPRELLFKLQVFHKSSLSCILFMDVTNSHGNTGNSHGNTGNSLGNTFNSHGNTIYYILHTLLIFYRLILDVKIVAIDKKEVFYSRFKPSIISIKVLYKEMDIIN